EDANRRVVRRARALRRVAIPAAILELLADETAGETLRRTPEVGAEREGASVDARLHFAVEERLRAKRLVPSEARLKPLHRVVDGGVRGIDAGRAQQLHREERRQPVGLVVAVPRPVRSLPGEDLGAEALTRDARTLRGDRGGSGVREIAHRLPAYRRVRIEQPADGVHERDSTVSPECPSRT